MFKLQSMIRLPRRSHLVLLLVVGFVMAMLPSVVMAAPLSGMPNGGMHEGMHQGMGGGNCASYYMVRKGENLSTIAMRSGVSIWALRDVNGIGDANKIFAGQWLCIPHAGHQGGHEMGHDMGHGMDHEMGHGMGHEMGHGWNTYVVRKGDNLSSIAMRYGTCVRTLMDLNHIGDPNKIYAGEVLRLS